MKEEFFVYCHASIMKYLNEAGLGVPLIFSQHASETDKRVGDSIEFLITGPMFNRVGTASEHYGMVKIDALIKNKVVTSDLYYHQRLVGRAISVLDKNIGVYRIGKAGLDKAYVGYLRVVPTSTTNVNPTGAQEPTHTILTQVYEMEIC